MTKNGENGKIKVMHILPNLEIGGMENGVVNVASRMDKDAFEVSICCINGIGPLRERLSPNVNVLNLDQRAGKAWFLPLRLRKVIEREKVDIIHTHNSFAGIYGMLAGKLCRSIVIIHGEHGMIDYMTGYRRQLKKAACSLSDKVVTVSEGLKEDVRDTWNIPANKIEVILNGVDQEKFKRQRVDSIHFGNSTISKSTDQVVLGTVGRLSDQKNYPFLLDAISVVAKKHQNIRVVIVGDGPLRNHIQRTIDSLQLGDRVNLLGERSDIPQVLNFIDVFLFTAYRGEGMANCLLEAMSVGLPVIASEIKGNTEVVANGETGLLFPNNNQRAFIESLTQLIEKPEMRKAFGDAAKTRIEQRFSIERMVAGYERLYVEALNQRHGRGQAI